MSHSDKICPPMTYKFVATYYIIEVSTKRGDKMNIVKFQVGDLVYDNCIEKVGLITHVFDEIAYKVLFAEGEYTCFIEDLEEL